MGRMFGGTSVDFCHNPTAMTSEDDYMGFLGDLTQAGTQKLGRITAEVDNLVSHLKEAVAAVGPSGRVVHIAHSQGALLTALAAKRLAPEERRVVEVVAFGGAAALTRAEYPSFRRLVNYYAVNDPLLHVVPPAVRALRSGFGFGVPAVAGADGDHRQTEPEFVFLSPRAGDPVEDHMLFGPTYGPALAWEGQRYQQKYMSLIERNAYRANQSMSVFTEKLEYVLRERLGVLVAFLYQLALLCERFYCWQRDLVVGFRNAIVAGVVVPIAHLLRFLLRFLVELRRVWAKDEERFEPVELSFSA